MHDSEIGWPTISLHWHTMKPFVEGIGGRARPWRRIDRGDERAGYSFISGSTIAPTEEGAKGLRCLTIELREKRS